MQYDDNKTKREMWLELYKKNFLHNIESKPMLIWTNLLQINTLTVIPRETTEKKLKKE